MIIHTGEKACKRGSTLALKPAQTSPRRSPKQGYRWSHEKDLCPPKIYIQKDYSLSYYLEIEFFGPKKPLMPKYIFVVSRLIISKPCTHDDDLMILISPVTISLSRLG